MLTLLSTSLYIGPGMGAGAIALVVIIMLIVMASVFMLLWIPLKRFIRNITGK